MFLVQAAIEEIGFVPTQKMAELMEQRHADFFAVGGFVGFAHIPEVAEPENDSGGLRDARVSGRAALEDAELVTGNAIVERFGRWECLENHGNGPQGLADFGRKGGKSGEEFVFGQSEEVRKRGVDIAIKLHGHPRPKKPWYDIDQFAGLRTVRNPVSGVRLFG